ncbi:unnamed protein product [Bursaphelenchus xylophilus]|uniref:(pine wood nematode) hypothetical protein n=1 Tax=Bursaphelenchus xylophilus TaxID=6326 RepID=A0A7I8WHU9_BURXY|nr:unnamed protein product [Bursaphelenchus xylophilus]CAG9109314.1 unnamed protein product [Bursaphelenchus xylophilus]
MEGLFAYQRVICLLDVDCFYVQVARKLNPELVGQPTVVCQYGHRDLILSSSYEARKMGVKKGFRLAEARQACPDVKLSRVPQYEGIELANLEYHYEESAKIFETVAEFCGADAIIERASVDECYIDLSVVTHRVINSQGFIDVLKSETPPDILKNVYIYPRTPLAENIKEMSENSDLNLHLLVGTFVAAQLCLQIKKLTGYECSAGVGMNKMLAKVVCGMNKPNALTVLPVYKIEDMVKSTNLKEFRGLGGLYGQEIVDKLNVKNLGDLQSVPDDVLRQHFRYGIEKLRQLSYGFEDEPVADRLFCKQLSLSKQNTSLAKEELWDFTERMAKVFVNKCLSDKNKYKRIGKKMEVTVIIQGRRKTKTLTIPGCYGHGEPIKTFNLMMKKFFTDLYGKEKVVEWATPITHIGLSVSGFEPVPSDVSLISDYFKVAVEDMDVRPIPRPAPVYQRMIEATKERKEVKNGRKNKKQKEKMKKAENNQSLSRFLKKPVVKTVHVEDNEVIELDSEDGGDVNHEEGVQILKNKPASTKKQNQSTGLEKWLNKKKIPEIKDPLDDEIEILEVECARGDDEMHKLPDKPVPMDGMDISLDNLPDPEDPFARPSSDAEVGFPVPMRDESLDFDEEDSPGPSCRTKKRMSSLELLEMLISDAESKQGASCDTRPPKLLKREPLRELTPSPTFAEYGDCPMPLTEDLGDFNIDYSIPPVGHDFSPKKSEPTEDKLAAFGFPEEYDQLDPEIRRKYGLEKENSPPKEENQREIRYSLFDDLDREWKERLKNKKIRRLNNVPTGLGTSKQ